MCGICGFIKFDKRVAEEEKNVLREMTVTLTHRGPDAQDTLVFDNVAMGFTRLSIIGLSDGMQPLTNEDGTVILICNGEIFNYIELRKQLQKKGHLFKTHTDVEVILHLYEENGMNFLNQLNGQFAFALYDKKCKRLYCVRDQLGILPFFYTKAGNNFIFASEIKAIIRHPAVQKEVDRVGLDQTFNFAGLISPRTMFRNIHSLENGHYLMVEDNGTVTNAEYWDLIYPAGERPMNGKSEMEYIDELEGLFEDSIRLRLRADVPSGFYLSGGLDSSMIAVTISRMLPGVSKEAFSIDFMDSQHSESVYQKIIAKESNALLNQKTFFYEDISGRLRHSVYHSECPIKETYNTASLSLSEAVRAKGIKVIQSGEGADEFFAGYVGYRFDKMRKMNVISNPSHAAEKELCDRLWGDSSFFYERNFSEFDAVKKNLYSDDIVASFDEVNSLNHFVINKERLAGLDVLNKRAYIDYKLRLVDHLVSDHGDRMAMANSVEVRYPFLDKNLIEFSTTLPSEMKLNDFTEKYILRRLASRFLPKAVMEREKFHFIAPGSPYLLQKNIEYVNDMLSYDRIKRQGFFNPDRIEALKKAYSQPGFTVNAPYESDLLIIVLTFGIFLDVFFED
jgi:asparagine synthase (glutamine-hydrolysing)